MSEKIVLLRNGEQHFRAAAAKISCAAAGLWRLCPATSMQASTRTVGRPFSFGRKLTLRSSIKLITPPGSSA